MRDWAAKIGLPLLPEQARSTFLHGAPGQAFDASTAGVKLVLLSSDDGLCSALTNQVTGQQVTDALESGFRQAGLTFRLAIDRDDPRIGAIHDREYLAAKDQRAWRILAATLKDEKGGEAMLTGAPELK